MEQDSGDVVILGAGCFWAAEDALREVGGVIETRVGWSGGHVASPTEEQIHRGDTGHTEVVRVTFDPARVTLEALLDAFFGIHDATRVPDGGPLERSVIYCLHPAQEERARAYLERRVAGGAAPVVTTVDAAGPFYPAPESHQCRLAKQRGARHGDAA